MFSLVLAPVHSYAQTYKIAGVQAHGLLQSDDGSTLVLAGLGEPSEPELASAALKALTTLCQGQEIEVVSFGYDRNKHLLVLPFLKGAPAQSVQERVLAEGFFYVLPMPEIEDVVQKLLKAESIARVHNKGLWANPLYQDQKSQQVDFRADHFSFVSGVVQSVAEFKDRTYLNFGEDWKTDFSVQLSPETVKKMKQKKAAPKTLIGKEVRVRGMIENSNGPLIIVSQPWALTASP